MTDPSNLSEIQTPDPVQATATVILVHGTFAAADEDEGTSWWQVNSSFSERLRELVSCEVEFQVFHWSGKNSEYSRILAGRKLLKQLRDLENHGRSIHVVGHSHGGSVIWQALKESVRNDAQLDNLQTWTTVGTPFLIFGPKRQWWLRITAMAATCFLYLMFAVAYLSFVKFPRVAKDLSTFVNADMLWQVGLAALFLIIAFTFYLRKSLAVRLTEINTAASDIRFARHALRRYGPAWLALTSKDDEAVSGLFRTLNLQTIGVVSPWKPDPFFLDQGWFFLVTQTMAKYTYGALFNRIVRSRVNTEISRRLQAFSQGNDLPGRAVTSVQREPIRAESQVPTLPPDLEQSIADVVNASVHSLVPQIRASLFTPQQMNQESLVLSGSELIHTSYYDAPGVIQLIARHITGEWKTSSPADSSLVCWYGQFVDQRDQYVSVASADKQLICLACGFDEPVIAWKTERHISIITFIALLLFLPIGIFLYFTSKRRVYPKCAGCGVKLDPAKVPAELL